MDQSKIDKNSLEVYVLYSHLFFPLNFAVHVWFVINDHGELTRWDGGEFIIDGKLQRGVHKNVLPPFAGFRVFPWIKSWRQRTHVIKKVGGESAKQLADFLTNHASEYPFKDTYRLTGPNSNTFAQWVIDETEIDAKLPRLAIGKNYLRTVS